ncbi:MAG: EF-P lysine aminoacylase EpmA [Desulfobulbaceae bacterium]
MLPLRRLHKRSQLLQGVRAFFLSRGYLEVDTPIRLATPLPESHIRSFPSGDRYLHSSPEQCMKRLLAAGAKQLFQVCHCFRMEEKGRYHETEFTMLEWYRVGWSYRELMDECETFVRELAAAVEGLEGVEDGTALVREGRKISLAPPWPRVTVDEVFRGHAGMGAAEAVERELFDELLVTRIEPRLGWERPVFLCDYPAALGSLARKKPGDATVVERFELYAAGIELANGFSELTDPDEQRRRFQAEMEKGERTGNPFPAMPERFLADLGRLGDTAGVALGLDRLFMILFGCDTVAGAMCMPPEEA